MAPRCMLSPASILVLLGLCTTFGGPKLYVESCLNASNLVTNCTAVHLLSVLFCHVLFVCLC